MLHPEMSSCLPRDCTVNLPQQKLLKYLPRLFPLFLPRDHAIQKLLHALLEILDVLLVKLRHLRPQSSPVHQPRQVFKFLPRIQCRISADVGRMSLFRTMCQNTDAFANLRI